MLMNFPLGMEAWYTPGSGSPSGDRRKAWASRLGLCHTVWGEVIGRRPTTKNLQLLAGVRSPLGEHDVGYLPVQGGVG